MSTAGYCCAFVLNFSPAIISSLVPGLLGGCLRFDSAAFFLAHLCSAAEMKWSLVLHALADCEVQDATWWSEALAGFRSLVKFKTHHSGPLG